MTPDAASPSPDAAPAARTEHVDVLVIGAGISGIGAAYELTQQCPDRSFLVLEALESFGGTWLWHRYPGVRSDSDLFTFGFRFKPWRGDPIASRQQILDYLGEAISENDLGRHIRYQRRVIAADWDSAAQLWRLSVTAGPDGTPELYTCRFLWMCQGYYRHARGYTPQWPGMDTFQGTIVHPQTWPDDIETDGRRIVVIGSGATAATLVPALAGRCAHVTMLQRSPTYFAPGQNKHPLAETLRELDVDEATVHDIVRKKIVLDQHRFLRRAVETPERARADLLNAIAAYLPQEVVDEHFSPKYRPWQQRIAVAPDGDLFQALRDGLASVVTDEIDAFTETGLRLASGNTLDADIIVTATGFEISVLGDIAFAIDGEPLDFARTITWRGMMFTGVPNMAWIFGYFRAASWTLRVDLVCDFVCRLLNHMAAIGAGRVDVALRPGERDMPLRPWIDAEVFNPGYLMRGLHLLPRSGAAREWAHSQDYMWEKDILPTVDLDDEVFRYTDPAGRPLSAASVPE
ncbi:MAG: NAD(P)/FAD-dependent oxidoreductase [Phenylobacterium sp.]|uniref:flavin-containing monooxygenase n=1 Tax=Phenylobacterium sp. TaxID=1871053 RepID=UPI001A55FCA6|nr:NAD(P)/FAD-dependent oxidoreductase [Phenylobacterium sp.]MBL8772410.1 NAD(P)/FAD-dependent oxidoreductase [Phenylobacterium sp.]